MKTTVEISDSLFAKARRHATRNGLTMKALIELGLRRVVEDKPAQPGFRLRDASVAGEGLQADMQDADWDRIRAAIYEGRGG